MGGDGEKFYPSFYNNVQNSDGLFPRLSKNSILFLGYELANHIVAYLSHGHTSTAKVKVANFKQYFLIFELLSLHRRKKTYVTLEVDTCLVHSVGE